MREHAALQAGAETPDYANPRGDQPAVQACIERLDTLAAQVSRAPSAQFLGEMHCPPTRQTP